MDGRILPIALAVVTLLIFVVIAVVSKRKTEKRIENENATKSTLAADKPSKGNPADV